jgi:hypothetical protein
MRILSGGEGGRRPGTRLELKGEGEYTTNWGADDRKCCRGNWRRLGIQVNIQLGK